MFKIVPNPTFPAVCKITRLGDDAPGVLNLVFRHQGERAHAAWLGEAKDATDVDFLDHIIVSWDAADAEGRPVPYNKESLSMLLDSFPAAGREIFACYEATRSESRTGN